MAGLWSEFLQFSIVLLGFFGVSEIYGAINLNINSSGKHSISVRSELCQRSYPASRKSGEMSRPSGENIAFHMKVKTSPKKDPVSRIEIFLDA